MLTIQKATEGYTPNLKILIYGSAGTGKTSLAGTASTPLIFDFGGSGSHRAANLKDRVFIRQWWQTGDVFTTEFLQKLDNYNTIVLDDIGTIQTLITDDIIQGGNYLYTTNGTLTQSGWGQLKTLFTAFMSRLNALQKDIVLIAHDMQETIGDHSNKYLTRKPDIQGSTYKYLVRDFDLIGYLSTTKKGRTVEFNPSNVLVAKTFLPDLRTLEVPNCSQKAFANTLERLISEAKAQINAKSTTAKVYNDYKTFIDSFATPADFTELSTQIKADMQEGTLTPLAQDLIRTYAKARMEVLGIEYREGDGFRFKNGGGSEFEETEQPQQEQPQAAWFKHTIY